MQVFLMGQGASDNGNTCTQKLPLSGLPSSDTRNREFRLNCRHQGRAGPVSDENEQKVKKLMGVNPNYPTSQSRTKSTHKPKYQNGLGIDPDFTTSHVSM